jgi:cytochrome c oxidase cbb3-type subunit III
MSTALVATVLCMGLVAPQLRSQANQRNAGNGSVPQAGQQLFSSNCAGCHGLDGRGGEHGPNIATTSEVQRLGDRDILRIVRDGISGAGMPAFHSKFDDAELKALLSYLRILQGKNSAVSVPGNPEKGHSLFYGKAKCAECHMVAGKGGFIGPDLSAYGAEHSPDVIRNAILDPNKNLDPRRGTVTAVTRDGQRYRGRALNEDNFSVQLQTLDGNFHFFDKSMLADLEHEPRSVMPSNYGSMLSSADLDDLVSYLMTATAQQPPKPGEDDES